MPSGARVIVDGEMMLLVVPLGEVGPDPSYRVTAFGHNGDWGMGPDEYWSGDNEPRVADGLTPVTMPE